MNSHKHIALLFNKQAGKGKALATANHIQQKLVQLAISFQVFDTQWPNHLYSFSEAWLVGGDGTLNFFINKYPEIKMPIALFKGGSGNDFAWKLYGDISLDAYFERALTEDKQAVDAGSCNGKLFINGVGIGFDGEVVQAMGSKKMFSAGHLSYLAVVLQKIFSYHEKQMLVEVDEKIIDSKLLMIHVANASRYGGGFMVAPQAVINDGLLDVIMSKPLSVYKRLVNLPKIEKGTHLHLPFVQVFTCKKISVTAAEKITAHLDGELMIDTKFMIEILPQKFLFR